MPARGSTLAASCCHLLPKRARVLTRVPLSDWQYAINGASPGLTANDLAHAPGGDSEFGCQGYLSLTRSISATAFCHDLRSQLSCAPGTPVTRAVAEPVSLVLSRRSVAEVIQPVVVLPSWAMKALVSRRARSCEGMKHQQVNGSDLYPAVFAQSDTQVAVRILLRLQDLAPRRVPRQRFDLSLIRHFVQSLVALDGCPTLAHIAIITSRGRKLQVLRSRVPVSNKSPGSVI